MVRQRLGHAESCARPRCVPDSPTHPDSACPNRLPVNGGVDAAHRSRPGSARRGFLSLSIHPPVGRRWKSPRPDLGRPPNPSRPTGASGVSGGGTSSGADRDPAFGRPRRVSNRPGDGTQVGPWRNRGAQACSEATPKPPQNWAADQDARTTGHADQDPSWWCKSDICYPLRRVALDPSQTSGMTAPDLFD